MTVLLAELCRLVEGTLTGDGSTVVRGAATLGEAAAGEITLIDQPDKVALLEASPAVAVVVPRGVEVAGRPVIAVDDVHGAFSRIVLHFRPRRNTPRRGVSAAAYVSPTARLAEDVEVHPGATIGDDSSVGRGSTIHAGARILAGCRLGENVTVHPNAVLHENTVVGPRCSIHAGAVIGSQGFGYRNIDGVHRGMPQLGHVELGPDVEVGANTTIDRGTYGATRIGEGTKIDNQVQIAHNCRLGRHNIICSQVGIAGSTTTGDYVVMAGQAGVRDHVHIGDRAVLMAMSGVTNDVPAGVTMLGIPATPVREQKLKQAALSKLPEMRHELKQVQRTVEELSRRIGGSAAEGAPAERGGGRHAA
jgi:UDP-3-O-[3-hydroxymyristoyl] glucosamine N-acyltransferase